MAWGDVRQWRRACQLVHPLQSTPYKVDFRSRLAVLPVDPLTMLQIDNRELRERYGGLRAVPGLLPFSNQLLFSNQLCVLAM